jgi:hypothetical protein
MGSVPYLILHNQHKVTQLFLMLKLPYTHSGVGLLKTSFLAFSIRKGGPKLALPDADPRFKIVDPLRMS